jgi:hypothetical protein
VESVSSVRNLYQQIDPRQVSDLRAENQRLYRLILELVLDLNELEESLPHKSPRLSTGDEHKVASSRVRQPG